MLGHSDEALADLAQISKEDPAAAQAHLLAGQVDLCRDRVRLGGKIASEGALTGSQSHPCTQAACLDPTACCCAARAQRALQTLSRLAPMTFDNVFHWCLTRNTVWEPHERLQDLRRYVAADPDDRGSRVALAETLRQVGRREEAASVLSVLPESDLDGRAVREDRPGQGRRPCFRGDHRGCTNRSSRTDDSARPVRPGSWRRGNRCEALPQRSTRRTRTTAISSSDWAQHWPSSATTTPHHSFANRKPTIISVCYVPAPPTPQTTKTQRSCAGLACEAVHRNPEARAWYKLAVETNPLDGDAQEGAVQTRVPIAFPGPISFRSFLAGSSLGWSFLGVRRRARRRRILQSITGCLEGRSFLGCPAEVIVCASRTPTTGRGE